MGWGIDDLIDWLRDTEKTVKGESKSGWAGKPGQKSIQSAIVDPGRILSEFSGISQGVRAASPSASNKDRALGLIALMGYLGGVDD